MSEKVIDTVLRSGEAFNAALRLAAAAGVLVSFGVDIEHRRAAASVIQLTDLRAQRFVLSEAPVEGEMKALNSQALKLVQPKRKLTPGERQMLGQIESATDSTGGLPTKELVKSGGNAPSVLRSLVAQNLAEFYDQPPVSGGGTRTQATRITAAGRRLDTLAVVESEEEQL